MVVYPTSDGKPMAETDTHRQVIVDSISVLDTLFIEDPMVYVSGNLLLYYVPGNKRRHVSPDVFVVRGVPKKKRDYYLLWEEGKGPDALIEITSSSTRNEDLKKKFVLYRDTLQVPEYFLFDPYGDYLQPPLRGFRLEDGEYAPIEPADGRLPSAVLGLHLERHGSDLRFYDPAKGRWLETPAEKLQHQEAEIRRLRQELETLRGQRG